MGHGWVQYIESISKLLPAFLIVFSIAGVIIGRLVYGISFLQPLEKIAHEQREYRRKNSQESLKQDIIARHVLLGNSLIAVGNLRAAMKEFTAALDIDPICKDASIGLFKSQLFDNIEDYGSTPEILIKKIDFISKRDENDAHGFYFMGLVYRNIDYKLSIYFFKKAIEIEPSFPDAYYRLGMIYETTDELNTITALKYYERALSLSRFNQNYLNNLAYQYLQAGRYSDAIIRYKELIAIDKDDILPYLTLSTAYLLNKQVEMSAEYVRKFIEKIQNDYTLINTGLNKLFWYFESFKKEKVLLDTPDRKIVYGYLSAFYKNYLLNDPDNAFAYLTQAILIHKTKTLDIQSILKLISFEIQTYLPKINLSKNVLTTLNTVLKDAFLPESS